MNRMATLITLKNVGILINAYYALKITKEAYDGITTVTSVYSYLASWNTRKLPL